MSIYESIYLSRRRLIGAAGVGTLAVSGALVGCSSSGGDETTGGSDGYKAGTAALKVQLGPEISGVLYPEGYNGPKARDIEKFGDGKQMRVLARVIPDITDYQKNAYSMWLAEKTGVNVKYEAVPMGDEGATKINAMIAGGDLPDAFMAGPEWMGGFTRSQLYVYGQQELFIPLDKLIDEYAPNVLEAFKQNPGLREYFTAPNGSMYAFPAINQCYHCKSAETRHMINQKMLTQVGAEMPKTMDEMHAVLGEFKKIAPDISPLSGNKDNAVHRLFTMAHLNTGNAGVVKKGDDLIYAPLTDQYREAMKMMFAWTKEGLIDKNSWTQTDAQMKKLIESPGGSKIGLLPAFSLGILTTAPDLSNKNDRVYDFSFQNPLTGPDGKAYVPWTYDIGGAVGLVISKDCADPVQMVRWADAQFGLLATLAMTWGQPGKGWNWAKEGEVGISGKQAIYSPLTSGLKNQTWWEEGPYNKMMDVRHAQMVDKSTSQEPLLYEAGKMYEPFAAPEEEYFSIPFFSEDQSAQYSEVVTNVDKALSQGLSGFGTAKADPNDDAQWQSFVKSLEAAGVQQYLDLLKEASQPQ